MVYASSKRVGGVLLQLKANNDSKQKWSMALNFLVQLMWVVTASFVLAKLGFEVGNL